jgi:hypothetical protein
MPVIRGKPDVTPLSPERRRSLVEKIESELSGNSTANGPVIFEIPLQQSNRSDVLVIWEEWKGVGSEDRTDLILEAYGERRRQIAQALGVIYEEAKEQHLLPYSVAPMARRGEANPTEVREGMLSEGGICLPGGEVNLRFPTMSMAEVAFERLRERLPDAHWSISMETAAPAV